MRRKRQRKLLHQLRMADQYVTVDYLAKYCGVSKRTIHADMQEIENELLTTDEFIDRKRGVGVALRKRKKVGNLPLVEEEKELFQDTMARRLNIMERLLFAGETLSYNHLSEDYLVSKSSIAKDLAYLLETFLSPYQELLKSNKYGTRLEGDEGEIQQVFLNFNRLVLEEKGTKQDQLWHSPHAFLYRYYGEEICKVCQYVFYGYLKDNANVISDQYVQNVLNILIILVFRSKKGFHHQKQPAEFYQEESFFQESAQALLEKISLRLAVRFRDTDVAFLSQHLIANRFEQTIEEGKNQGFTQDLIRRMSDSLKIEFDKDPKLVNQLSAHISAMVYRLNTKDLVENPFTEQVKLEFSLVFNLLSLLLVEMEKEYQLSFHENEIAFLTIYFQSAIERAKINKKILVVCQMGMATSELLMNRLKRTLPSLDTLELSSVAELEFLDIDQYDFIISTVQLDMPGKKVLLVSPFLTEKDIQKIKQAGYQTGDWYDQSLSQPRMEWTDYLREETIFLDTTFATKDELLAEIGQELVKQKLVVQEFVADIDHREKLGSTALPIGVAIPHGRPENARQTRIILVRNQKKIRWDKYYVDLVFLICIAKSEQTATRRILSGIYSLIEDGVVLQKLRQGKTQYHMMETIGGKQYE